MFILEIILIILIASGIAAFVFSIGWMFVEQSIDKIPLFIMAISVMVVYSSANYAITEINAIQQAYATQCQAAGGDRIEQNHGYSCWNTQSGKRIFFDFQ